MAGPAAEVVCPMLWAGLDEYVCTIAGDLSLVGVLLCEEAAMKFMRRRAMLQLWVKEGGGGIHDCSIHSCSPAKERRSGFHVFFSGGDCTPVLKYAIAVQCRGPFFPRIQYNTSSCHSIDHIWISKMVCPSRVCSASPRDAGKTWDLHCI